MRSERRLVADLRQLALRGLRGMYRPDAGLFAQRVRRAGQGIIAEGECLRYSAIAVIGLAGEEPATVSEVLAGDSLTGLCSRLIEELPGDAGRGNGWMVLGDTAIVAWACCAAGHPDRHVALERLARMRPDAGAWPTVDAAWALAALCHEPNAHGEVRDRLAGRLARAQAKGPGVFPHRLGRDGEAAGPHISCFADMVYPILALSLCHSLTGDREALDAAERGAARICGTQGPAGQWWWHYDRRTGAVVERYPVYAIHQDAMGPMALFALRAAGGTDYRANVERGLRWLESSPELRGGSLIDRQAGIVWRKVGRREPRKLSRYLQAAASRIHPALRFPGIDALFPAVAVDYEDRPYHPGWLLYAFPARSAGSAAEEEMRR